MIELVLGILAAVITIGFIRRKAVQSERGSYATVLIVMAIVYVAFPLWTRDLEWVLIETAGLAGFIVIAVLGRKVSPWFLVVGMFAHVIWDMAHHANVSAAFVPQWYPTACFGYDLLVAGYIAWRIKDWNAALASEASFK